MFRTRGTAPEYGDILGVSSRTEGSRATGVREAYARCMATTAEAGWYDDGTGKQRWWDGARWTEQYDDRRGRQRWWDGNGWTSASKFSGEEQTFAGLVVDGRWIHFGAMSEPIAN